MKETKLKIKKIKDELEEAKGMLMKKGNELYKMQALNEAFIKEVKILNHKNMGKCKKDKDDSKE
jgi:hypothetical protein